MGLKDNACDGLTTPNKGWAAGAKNVQFADVRTTATLKSERAGNSTWNVLSSIHGIHFALSTFIT